MLSVLISAIPVSATPMQHQFISADATIYDGHTSATTKTDNTATLSATATGPVVAWLEYDITAIPDTAHIIQVKLTWYKIAGTGQYSFRSYDSDALEPLTATAAQIFGVIQTGGSTYTYKSYASTALTTSYPNQDLGDNACADLEVDLAAGRNWWVVAVSSSTAGSGQTMASEEDAGSNQHVITITYAEAGEHYIGLGDRVYEDGSSWVATYSVTLEDADGVATFTIDGNTSISYDGNLVYLSYPAHADYQRFLYLQAEDTDINTYALNVGATNHYYLWIIRDLLGIATGGYVKVEKLVSGSYVTVEITPILDTINGIPTALSEGQVYKISVLEDDGITPHNFGYFLATSANKEPILTLSDLTFTQEIQYVASSLPVVTTRSADKTEIDLSYANELTPTYNLTTSYIVIKNRAGTTIYSANSTDQIHTFTASGLTNTTDLVVFFDTTSGYFGAIEGAWAFEGFDNYAAIPNIGDIGLTFGGINSNSILGVGLLMFIAGIFSAGSAPVGAVVTVLVGGMLARIDFITVTDSLLALALCLAVIFAVSKRGGNV